MKMFKFLETLDESSALKNLKTQGKAKNKPDSDFCPVELEIGVEVELEHVKDREAAKEIAKDHLEENPNYYTKVLGPAEKEVMDKAEKIVKKHGFKSVEDYHAKKGKKNEALNEAEEKPEDYEAEPEEAEEEKVPTEEQLIDWFRKHPYPEDEDLHKWVEKNGWNIHEVEDMIYKFATDHIKEMDKNGGKEE